MVWELAKSLKEIASNKEGLTWAYRGISIHHRHGRETLQQAGMKTGCWGLTSLHTSWKQRKHTGAGRGLQKPPKDHQQLETRESKA